MQKLEWNGCYDNGWQSAPLVAEAYAHPAKISFGLAERIYRHMLAEGWLEHGARVIDPFGGIGGCAFHAALYGMHWTGVELEPKFVDLANGYDCNDAHLCPDCAKLFHHRTVLRARVLELTEWLKLGIYPAPKPDPTEKPAVVITPEFGRDEYEYAEPDADEEDDEEDVPPDWLPLTAEQREAFAQEIAAKLDTLRDLPLIPCGEHVTGNLELWRARYAPHFPGYGSARILQGDSRNLAALVGTAECSMCGGSVSIRRTGQRKNTSSAKGAMERGR